GSRAQPDAAPLNCRVPAPVWPVARNGPGIEAAEQGLETPARARIFVPWGKRARTHSGETIMASLTRYRPFEDAFDDFFRGFLVRPMAFANLAAPQLKLDVKEDDGAYTVYADIPGVKKDDISVTIDGNEVAISAEVKRDREEKQGDKLVHAERYVGKVYRSFTLAQE